MFWVSIYYMKMFYALMSFPFLLFSVPVLGTILVCDHLLRISCASPAHPLRIYSASPAPPLHLRCTRRCTRRRLQTHAKPTGYDKMGVLCPKLGSSLVAKKLKLVS